MYTIEEIKSIIYPKDKIDMVEVLKDLLKLKFKEGELVTFSGVYLYDIGDPDLYVNGVALINGNLICTAEVVYGGDTDFSYIGTVGETFDWGKGIKLTDDAIMKICKKILDGGTNISFNFLEMKGFYCCYLNGEYMEERLNQEEDIKKEIEGFCNGTKIGYVEW